MAIKRKNSENTEDAKVTLNIVVKRAKDLEKVILFDAEINGIMIYGMSYRSGTKNGRDWALVDFPSRKGNDGKYYNWCYVQLDEADIENIEKQIEALIQA